LERMSESGRIRDPARSLEGPTSGATTVPVQVGARGHRPDCVCKMCANIRKAVLNRKPRAEGSGHRIRKRLKKRAFVGAFATPGSPTFANASASAKALGYPAHIGQRMLRERDVRSLIVQVQEQVGITDQYLAKRLKEGLEARETKVVTHEGQVTDKVDLPDFHAREKYLQMAHKLRGDFPRDDMGPQAALILRIGDEPLPENEWEKSVQQLSGPGKQNERESEE